MSPAQFIDRLVTGIQNMTLPIILYLLSMCFSSLLEQEDMGEFLNNTVTGLSSVSKLMPAVMFLVFTLLAFLAVVGYMPVLQYIIGSDYREGLGVVPIVMVAEIMMGVYFNLSFWYKLIDKTIYGAVFSFIGCAVLVAVNILFIPKYGYWACAWGGVAGYGTAMVLSYIVGQIKNPIDYPMKDIAIYVVLTAVLFGLMQLTASLPTWAQVLLNTVLIIIFLAYIEKKDLPLKSLPVVGKYFRK
jgi:O-antigen/teichoic acid export membrane protein